MSTMELKKNFYWAGILDPDLEVFDIIMHTDFGTTYNSYLLKGSEKTALFETEKEKWADEYIAKCLLRKLSATGSSAPFRSMTEMSCLWEIRPWNS